MHHNKNMICLILLLLISLAASAQNQPPEVTNVTFEQRTDGSFKVDIYYDLYDADGDEMTVSMEVSNDEGQTYDFAATLLTGDVGEGITSGTGKQIVWDFGSEHPDYFSDQIKLKIIADDGQGGGSGECGEPIEYAGKSYNTVQIGEQCWLRENLDVGTMIESNSGGFLQTDNGVIEKYCYDNDPANCETYGGLYEWPEAMQYTTEEGAQGICPDGWHIPTRAEFEELEDYVDDKAAALIDESETLNFTPTVTQNETGFSALFAGRRHYGNGSFDYLGSNTIFWSSTESDSYYAHYMYLDDDRSYVGLYDYNKDYGFSVRCVQD